MYWLAQTEKVFMSPWDCFDSCQDSFGTDEIRIFGYPADDYRRCACRHCPEDYMRGNNLNVLLDLMGCKDASSMNEMNTKDFGGLLTYPCKPEGDV